MSITNINEAQAPKIQRGRVDSITIYEITESELRTLESGTPSGYLFHVFLALITLAISFLVTITTTEIKSDRLFSVYTLLVIASFIGSVICFCFWSKFRQSISVTIQTIKNRVIPPTPAETSDPTTKE